MFEVTVFDTKNDLTKLKTPWEELVVQNDVSYFLTWGWIETWLLELPKECRVYQVLGHQNGELKIAFFIGLSKIKRSKFFNIRQLALNTAGHLEYDNIWIEYNNFLIRPGSKIDWETILEKIPFHWEEFYLPGLDLIDSPIRCAVDNTSPFEFITDVFARSPYVDLEKIRKAGNDYITLLSRNTRSQIRRSFRILEKLGIVELEIPIDVKQAFQIYQEMVDLHQITWETRGEAGVFSSRLFCRFHERLIRNRFDKGEIQLLRIHAGGKTIGCLYNFLWQGRVYFYQCGFSYDLGKYVQPGMVSHLMAVEYNASQGQNSYDFLAGDARYKTSLATDYNEMGWARIQRSSLKLNLEKKLHGLSELFGGN